MFVLFRDKEVKKGEVAWDIKVAVSAECRERCIKRSVRTAKKNVKFLSNQEKIVRYIAKSAFRSAKIAAVKDLYLNGQNHKVQ